MYVFCCYGPSCDHLHAFLLQEPWCLFDFVVVVVSVLVSHAR